jgi:hypothetical protein
LLSIAYRTTRQKFATLVIPSVDPKLI